MIRSNVLVSKTYLGTLDIGAQQKVVLSDGEVVVGTVLLILGGSEVPPEGASIEVELGFVKCD